MAQLSRDEIVKALHDTGDGAPTQGVLIEVGGEDGEVLKVTGLRWDYELEAVVMEAEPV